MASVAWLGFILLLSNAFVIKAQYGGFGPSGYPGYGPPSAPYPIIVKSNDDDGMKHILPILLLLLCDNGGFGGGFGGGCGGGCGGGGCGGGCGNGGNGGCQTIPIPYPIPIPINNPIVNSC